MGIFRKLLLVLFSLIILPAVSHAQVVINEIMYDLSGADTGREWIEIYNSGSSAADLSSWKFFENDTNHGLNSISGGVSLPAGGYAIIADDSTKFLLDWPNFSGTLFDSTFSLNNTGETISLKDDTQMIVGEVTYQSLIGANGDGNTLSRSGSIWIAASPTPGFANSSISVSTSTTATTTTDIEETIAKNSSSSNNQSSSNTISTHYSATPLTNVNRAMNFAVGAGRDRLSSAGSPLEFKVETNIEYNSNSIFVWNFGDGSEGVGEVVSHTYMYPGDYVLILNVSGPRGKSVSRASVKIVYPEFSITQISKERVEIANNSKSEVSLFGRALVAGNKIFIFPRDTIIKAGQRISFGANITGLDLSKNPRVSLIVVGTEVKSYEVLARVEAERQEEIKRLSLELNMLQDKLAALQTGTRLSNVAQKQVTPLEVTVDATQTGESQTALVLESVGTIRSTAIDNWLKFLKRFFLRIRE